MLILRPKYIQMPLVKILQTHNESVLASAIPTKTPEKLIERSVGQQEVRKVRV
jgi:hypothetical protein